MTPEQLERASFDINEASRAIHSRRPPWGWFGNMRIVMRLYFAACDLRSEVARLRREAKEHSG